MGLTQIEDQASGLRARAVARLRPERLQPPIIYADMLLFRGVRAELPRGALIWHWRSRATPAVGWDLQARLHVVGSPEQFDLAKLHHWRALCPQWRLIGRQLEPLQIADVACLWLKSGGELLPRLKILLGWLSKNRPAMPIILAGLGSGAAHRLQNWAHSRYPLRCLTPVQELKEIEAQGYYRLVRLACVSSSGD